MRRHSRITFLLFATFACALVLACAPRANASVIFVTSQALLDPFDTYDWETYGLNAVPNGTYMETPGLFGFTLTNSQNNAQVDNSTTFSISNGGTDDYLSASVQSNQVFRMDFDTGTTGVGALMEWNDAGGALYLVNYTIQIFGAGNVLLGSASVNVGSNGSPSFLGFRDDLPEIMAVEFGYNGPSFAHYAGLADPQFGAAPEPGTLVSVGVTLLLGLAAIRRRRCR